MSVPNDPIILLSYINTKLRDFYPSLEELGKSLDIDIAQVKSKLAAINYRYDETANRFI